MSPAKNLPRPAAAIRQVDRLAVLLGASVHAERARRRWTLAHVARRAGLSIAAVHAVESGRRMSLQTYAALAAALGLRLEADLVDPRVRRHTGRDQDPVHAAMGELEAARLRSFGYSVAIDEPYQHYQFAGRADVLSWDLQLRALLHIENRTRFPDIQAAAGSWAAKRAYLAPVLAQRLGLHSWQSITHVMACLWSSEVLHSLRLRSETFRSLCPHGPDAFQGWWTGQAARGGVTSSLILLDPLAVGRQRQFVGLARALDATIRPRHRGYADAARFLSERARE